ncbi:Beta-galactosidase trimerization domain protein [compost metagenome]
MASFTNTLDRSPAVTRNRYGKGEAIYVAIPAETSFLSSLLDQLYPDLGIVKGPSTPNGVVARKLEDSSVLYVNTTGAEQTIHLDQPASGLLSGKRFEKVLILDGYETELLT